MEKLFKQLSDAQASLFVLFQKTWLYHWNVVGSDFHQLHTLFGDQYNAMFEEIDRMTEHMRYLGMKPVSTLTRITEVSAIQEASSNVSGKEMASQLKEDHGKFCDLLKEISEESENQKSYATANLVQDLMESHGKYYWMLDSYLK